MTGHPLPPEWDDLSPEQQDEVLVRRVARAAAERARSGLLTGGSTETADREPHSTAPQATA